MTTKKAPRVQARTGGRGSPEREAASCREGSTLRARREARGLTLTQAAALLAAEHGGQPETWRVQLTRYESGEAVPRPERYEQIRALYDADSVRTAAAELLSAIGHARLGRMVEAHGERAMLDALGVVAGVVQTAARRRVRR